jgi:hypothetical protein
VTAVELAPEAVARLSAFDASGHVGILLGAGASVAAGLPDWDRLSVELLVLSGAIADRDTARAFLSRQDPQLAAEAAKAAAGAKWDDILRSALYGSVSRISPAPLHSAAAQFANTKSPAELSLFTLNFDDLLEIAVAEVMEESGKSLEVFSRSRATPRAPNGTYEVHHLHGLFGPTTADADDITLTLSDFNSLALESHPWQAAALQESLQRGPLFLAGTSYRDPDIRQWVHSLTDTGQARDILVFLTRQGLGLDRDQFARVMPALTAQWAAIGVGVLSAHDHDDAAQALRELPHLESEGYESPQLRAAKLWQLHVDSFGRLQHEYSDALDEDLRILRDQFPTIRKLTLWLVDDQTQLVRWSANDVQYRSPDELRRILPGFDSAWTAGACLGRNEMLIQEVPDRSATDRWSSVAATPLVVATPGGPDLPTGVISAASTATFGDNQADEVVEVFAELSAKWADVLANAGNVAA